MTALTRIVPLGCTQPASLSSSALSGSSAEKPQSTACALKACSEAAQQTASFDTRAWPLSVCVTVHSAVFGH